MPCESCSQGACLSLGWQYGCFLGNREAPGKGWLQLGEEGEGGACKIWGTQALAPWGPGSLETEWC